MFGRRRAILSYNTGLAFTLASILAETAFTNFSWHHSAEPCFPSDIPRNKTEPNFYLPVSRFCELGFDSRVPNALRDGFDKNVHNKLQQDGKSCHNRLKGFCRFNTEQSKNFT